MRRGEIVAVGSENFAKSCKINLRNLSKSVKMLSMKRKTVLVVNYQTGKLFWLLVLEEQLRIEKLNMPLVGLDLLRHKQASKHHLRQFLLRARQNGPNGLHWAV